MLEEPAQMKRDGKLPDRANKDIALGRKEYFTLMKIHSHHFDRRCNCDRISGSASVEAGHESGVKNCKRFGWRGAVGMVGVVLQTFSETGRRVHSFDCTGGSA